GGGAGGGVRQADVAAAVRWAPAGSRRALEESASCEADLLEELRLFERARVVVGLGRIGWLAYLRARRTRGQPLPRPLPLCGHAAVTRFTDGTALIGSYHPSQQNTFTGKLTRPMLRRVFQTARALLDG